MAPPHREARGSGRLSATLNFLNLFLRRGGLFFALWKRKLRKLPRAGEDGLPRPPAPPKPVDGPRRPNAVRALCEESRK